MSTAGSPRCVTSSGTIAWRLSVSDVDELIRELDLDAALARTYELGEGMRRRSTNRRRWATGGGLVAAAVVAALLVPALGDDDPSQPVGVTGIAGDSATTEAPP